MPDLFRVVNDARCVMCRQRKAVCVSFALTLSDNEDAIFCEDCLANGAALLGYGCEPKLREEVEALRKQADADADELRRYRAFDQSLRASLKKLGTGPEAGTRKGPAAKPGPEANQTMPQPDKPVAVLS